MGLACLNNSMVRQGSETCYTRIAGAVLVTLIRQAVQPGVLIQGIRETHG